jgi:hypothetical protein
MITVSVKAEFYAHVAAERAAIWPVAAGVAFVSRREHWDWGIALHIEGRALRPEQLRATLERRFSQAELFNDFFVFLNVQEDLVVWHAVPGAQESPVSLDSIRRQELELAGLAHLSDVRQ